MARKSDITENIRVIVVPHTHRDRAWYVPFEEFRRRLVRMVDRLIRTLERDPKFRCFTLDGQAIVLRGYLEIRVKTRCRAYCACSGR